MSGLEIFGIIGSAISVIEGIIAAKSYTSDLRHSTKEREQIKNELQRINSLVVSLQEVISSMPRNSSWLSLSQAFNDFKLSLEKTQNVIQESSKRVMWTADKAKIRVLQNQYERLGTILSISFTSYNTQMSVNQYASSVKEFDRINTNLDSIRF
ncbi:hypothetical protein DL96DRAFT_148995 [Flagelloscypha sp. PMI_526]|nr:hypothetical protein DL96DRAFT_148995 [Flagelloscypha sp. PMI_526]